MILSFWLAAFFSRLTLSAHRSVRKIRRRRQPTTSMHVEFLEQRRLLTAAVVTGVEPVGLNYTENAAATVVTATISISDSATLNLKSATVWITNHQSGDVLTFTPTGNVNGSYDSTSGKLVLTGPAPDTIANYLTVLRSVSYQNTLEDPSPLARTVTFTVIDDVTNDSTTAGPGSTRTINVTPVNDPPILNNLEVFALNYTEGGPAPSVTSTISVNDPDSANLQAVTIQISANYLQTEDQLSYGAGGPAGISGVWNPTTGTMTLSGADTRANYETAIRRVKYLNSSQAPSTATRTLTFTALDDLGAPSVAVTRDINLITANDNPVLVGIEGSDLTYNETVNTVNSTNPLVLPISASIAATDVDSANLQSATIKISSSTYQSSQDELRFAGAANITFSWDISTGTMTLTGPATLADFTAALRLVSYVNTSDAPNTSNRVVQYQVTDTGGLSSNTLSRTIKIVAANDPPTTTGIELEPLNYIIRDTSTTGPGNNITQISASITAGDPDSGNLQSVIVKISENYRPSEDQLIFVPIAGINIGATWDAVTGTLTLSGVETKANYTAALITVKYTNLAFLPDAAVRKVTFQATDASGLPELLPPPYRYIVIVPIDIAPVLKGIEPTPLNYSLQTPPPANSPAVISTSIFVVDEDSTNLQKVSVRISTNYKINEDQLQFTNDGATMGSIAGNWDPATGTLTLSGVNTLAQYTKALQAVKYVNVSATPDFSRRTVSFTPTDELDLTGLAVTRDIVMVPNFVAPTLNTLESAALQYTEGVSPLTTSVPLTATLTVTDADSANMQGATVRITTNYQNGEDQLTFTQFTSNITGVWNAATGTMTLSGVDTKANYVTALKAIKYTNLSDAPTPLTRTVVFQITDEGGRQSQPVQRDIAITVSNDPPVLTGIEPTDIAYTENATVTLTSTMVVSDPDSLNITSATVKITGNYAAGEDKLVFSNFATITGVWDATTGTLTLTGSDTLVRYQTALRTVKYTNTSNAPSTLQRTVSFTVYDGALNSVAATRDINITAVNDQPVLIGIETTPLNYIENPALPVGPGNNVTPITSTIVATDPDNNNAQMATIKISANYQSGQDRLVFVDTANITGSFNVATGVLILSGVDTLSNYRAALRSVSYTNLSDTPNSLARTVTFQIFDEVGQASQTVNRVVNVTPANDRPVLIGLETGNLDYTENGTVFVTSSVIATDPDSNNASSATVKITTNYASNQDVLSFTNTATISGNWNPATGTLTLTGNDSLTNYRLALRSVTYTNTSNAPSAAKRTLEFQITDDLALPSVIVTRAINVIPVNDAPVLSSPTSGLAYVEGTGAKAINPTVVVADVDNSTLASAVIRLTTFVAAEDVLGFVPNPATMGNIAIASNIGGVLTLISNGPSATLAQWQAALRAVTYTNTSGNLNPVSRTVTFTANDGAAANNFSNPLTTTIGITAIFPPVLSGTSTLAYTEKDPATAINPSIVVADPGQTTLLSATITITNYVAGQDLLGFVNNSASMGNIAVQSNISGVLTLISAGGTATLAQWQNALRAVTYVNTSSDPSTATRSVAYQVKNNAGVNTTSNSLVSSITITAINDAPILTRVDGPTLVYVESSSAVAIIPNATITDPDSDNLKSAVIKITANYNAQGSQDTLSFTNFGNITGAWDAATGTLTLTGTSSVSNYRTALRSIKFFNTNDGTAPPDRTVTFVVTDDLGANSATISRTIDITPVNTAPVLSGLETTAKVYNLNDPYNRYGLLTSSINITDIDSTQMKSATIQITGNYNSAQDRLGFNIANTNITGSWNATTGTLTLSGVDSIANYKAALKTVVYYNFTGVLPQPNRTISFTVTDAGNTSSNTMTRSVQVTTSNTAATLTINSSGPLVYTENDPAKVIAPSVTIVDNDSQTIQGATITIFGNYQLNEDKLVFETIGNIKGVFQATTASLVLTGADTLSNYEAALETVRYLNVSHNPNPATRTVNFTISDGLSNSAVVSRSITVVPVNDPPVVLTNAAGALAYQPANGAVVIAPGLTLTDADNTNLTGATIRVSANFQRGFDLLSFANTAKITGSYDTLSGILTLTGTDTVTNYRTALQAVKYQYTGSATITKSVSFTAFDGVAQSVAVSRSINITP